MTESLDKTQLPERSEGAMLTEVLAQLGALRREVLEMKTTLSGGATGEGIYESNRALKRELLELTAKVVRLDSQLSSLKEQVANMKDSNLKTAGRWLDNVMPVLIAALVLGLIGMVWMNITTNQNLQLRQASTPAVSQIYVQPVTKK